MTNKISKDSGRPLYVQIQDIITDEIKTGRLEAGAPIYSEHDLAARLEVSRLTVRRAYSEMVKQGLLYSIHGKGTYVSPDAARNTVDRSESESPRTGTTVAVVFPEISQFFGPILHAIEEEATSKGMQIRLIFNSTLRAENDAIDRVISTPDIGGLIITPRRTASRSYARYEEIQRLGIPTVMVGKPPFHLHFDAVYCDDVVATYDLVTELIRRGHQRIAWLMDSSGDSEAVTERREGYLRALSEASRSDSALTMDAVHPDWEEELLSLMRGNDAPTAICSDIDTTAARALNRLLSDGFRIPDDVRVVGFDNYDLCENLPVPLSSMSQPRTEMGRRAFELLRLRTSARRHTERQSGANHVVFVPQIVERASSR